MDFICPTCKSDSIQRLAAVYEGGVSDVDGVGVVVGGGGIGIGVASGRSRTVASQRVAPPPTRGYRGPILLGSFSCFLFWATFDKPSAGDAPLFFIGGFLVALAWIRWAWKYNSKTWPRLKAEWDRSFVCRRCYAIFTVGDE